MQKRPVSLDCNLSLKLITKFVINVDTELAVTNYFIHPNTKYRYLSGKESAHLTCIQRNEKSHSKQANE